MFPSRSSNPKPAARTRFGGLVAALNTTSIPHPPSPIRHAHVIRHPRQRGIGAVLAMMFLVIFGSLAAAMAIVSQGNLRTADSHLKINRSLAAAEAGMNFIAHRLDQVAQGDPDDPATYPGVYTTAGLIVDDPTLEATDPAYAYYMWGRIADELRAVLAAEENYADNSPYIDTTATDVHGRSIIKLVIPATRVGPGAPSFSVVMMPHPLPLSEQPSDLGYDDPYYDALPYGEAADSDDAGLLQKKRAGIDFVVGESDPNPGDDTVIKPLDGTFIRVKVTAFDGKLGDAGTEYGGRVYRSISMDFKLGKSIPYAVLSRSRVMIGRNVQITGNVGSRFTEVGVENGHPIQVQSDFIGLKDELDEILSPPNSQYPAGGTFHNELVANDIDGDNRLNVYNDTETKDLPPPAAQFDRDEDGYVSEFDFFLQEFDSSGNDARVSLGEMTSNADDDTTATQLHELMDKNGDGFVDTNDFYSKVRGEISLLATKDAWNSGLSDWAVNGGSTEPDYKDYLQGAVRPDTGKSALTTGDQRLLVHEFTQHSFNTKVFADIARSGAPLDDQAVDGGVSEVIPASDATREEVPFGAFYPYDYYERTIYRNQVFENVVIPRGSNALFEDCRFIGVTFVDTEPGNGDENYNYVGMSESDGSPKHPDYSASIDGDTVSNTKEHSNNIRFDDCTFEGAIVSGDVNTGNQPAQFTHVRNKLTFTGTTRFLIEESTELSEAQKTLYQRSSLLLPHMSVEMGSFDEPAAPGETLELSGAVVAGLIDMRGQISVNGTLVTTFEPRSGEAPVQGDTSPQFNTTLGYFTNDNGDLETKDLPASGLGKIRITYDPTLALPDGIDGPVDLEPIRATYHEGGR